MMIRSLILTACCLFLAGCTTLHPAALPDSMDAANELTVKPGMKARVTLISGAILTGEVDAVGPESITLGKPSNYGYEKTEIERANIASLEVERDTRATSVLMGGTGLLFLLGAGLIILITQTVDGGGLS